MTIQTHKSRLNLDSKTLIDPAMTLSVHQQLALGLKLQITSGQIVTGTALPPEREWALSLGVARSTLRTALRILENDGLIVRKQGDGTFVGPSSQWRKRVDAACIGFVRWQPRLDRIIEELVGDLCREVLASGAEFKTVDASSPETSLQQVVVAERLDGLIIQPAHSYFHLDRLASVHVPKVLLEMRAHLPEVDCVLVDSVSVFHAATSELIRLGHKRIAYIGACLAVMQPEPKGQFVLAPNSELRFMGYRRALDQADIPFRPQYYAECSFDLDPVLKWLRERLQQNDMPTAIVAYDDTMAGLVIDALRSLGRSVPDDVSVTGFANMTPEAQSGNLATCEFDAEQQAKMAVRRVIERIRQGGMSGMVITVPSRFKPGRSIGPLREH
jgi:GntR family transcriptional regulator of arabinose operon